MQPYKKKRKRKDEKLEGKHVSKRDLKILDYNCSRLA